MELGSSFAAAAKLVLLVTKSAAVATDQCE